jgi:hypothetical protein
VQEGLAANNGARVLIARGLGGNRAEVYENEGAVRALWRGWRHYMEKA